MGWMENRLYHDREGGRGSVGLDRIWFPCFMFFPADYEFHIGMPISRINTNIDMSIP